MGRTKLRRLIAEECKWNDYTAVKHKHEFNIESCVELLTGDKIFYFHVMKCSHCNSFKSISREGAVDGFTREPLLHLPMIRLYKSHKTIGFKGATLRK